MDGRYMPHGYCLLWQPGLVTLHVLSDSAIALAYFAIAFLLRYFYRKRADAPFKAIFLMFAAFIALCGMTHVLNVITLWQPVYWIDGWVKAATAAVSIATAIILVPLIPQALSLRSPSELEALNRELSAAVERKNELLEAYRRQQMVASTLQRALLPQELPAIDGLRIDSAYVPAVSGTEIGGDWYDAFAVSEHCVALSVGDVAGHGLRAATTMGSIRQAVRLAARENSAPASVLQRVNTMLIAEEDGLLVSAFYALLDLESGSLRYSIAGHPAPLVVHEGSVRHLHAQGVLLGADAGVTFEEVTDALVPGDALVMYTDGLIEPTRDMIEGLHRLERAVVDETSQPSENLAESIQRRVFTGIEPFDDSALMVVRVENLVARSSQMHVREWTFDARSERESRRVRRALIWFLARYASDESDIGATELIVGELLGNVARHTSGWAHVAIDVSRGHAELRVADKGPAFSRQLSMQPDLLAEGGRGLFLIESLGRGVRIERTAKGNTVIVTLPVALRS